MPTVRLYASAGCIVKDSSPAYKNNTSSSVSNVSSPAVDWKKIAALFKLESLPAEHKFKQITRLRCAVWHDSSLNSGVSYLENRGCFYTLVQPYNWASAEFNTSRGYLASSSPIYYSNGSIIPSNRSEYCIAETGVLRAVEIERLLNNGCFFAFESDATLDSGRLTTALQSYAGSNKPYVELEIGSKTAYIAPAIKSPSAGSIQNPNKSIDFTFDFAGDADFAFAGDIYNGTAYLDWRDGTSGTVHTDHSASLSAKKITVAAGTFPRSANLQYRIRTTDGGGTSKSTAWTSFSTDLQLTASDLSPASGYVDETKANTFAWRLNATRSDQLEALTASASVAIQWRASSSGTTNTINASSLYSHTIPANTFPSTGSPQWRVRVTDSYANITYSDWQTFTTTDSQGTATPITPINSIVSGGAGTVFKWSYSSATGAAPSGATIQRSTDGSTWTNLKTVTGTATETTVDLSGYAGGQFYWRVRALNNDGVAGPWSDAVSFILLTPPAVPSVTATQTPRPSVSWQAAGQQAYQIVVDGLYDSGTVFGTAKNANLPIILPDGQQLIKVRVQNSLGLWSDFGTAPVNVRNTPGTAITLTAKIEGFSAVLSWSGGSYNRYMVYRDGKAIGLTTATTYTDHMIAGASSYHVIGIVNSTDMYTTSNTVDIRLCLPTPVIADANKPDWLDLKLSDNNYRDIQFNKTRAVTYRHYTGAKYPIAEFSNDFDKSVSFDAAFRCREDAEALEALIGTKVILKAKTGAYVGILAAQRTAGTFYESFQCQLQIVDNTEEVLL